MLPAGRKSRQYGIQYNEHNLPVASGKSRVIVVIALES
jgi:hypothetical protein